MTEPNLFMMCEKLNRQAISELPMGFHIRKIRENELDIWNAMPFDDPALAIQYKTFMTDFFDSVYKPKGNLFFEKCLFLCDKNDTPIGTCFVWKSYNKVNTIHWYKILKNYEGLGLGRALLSATMKDLPDSDFPIFLHTQPSSCRAIHLYSAFGFKFLSDAVVGNRENNLQECLSILEKSMPTNFFKELQITNAPDYFLKAVSESEIIEF